MNAILVEQLDQEISALLEGKHARRAGSDPRIGELMRVAEELRCWPRAEFRERLGIELRREAVQMRLGEAGSDAADTDVPPSHRIQGLDVPEFRSLTVGPIHKAHLAASFALHVAALAGILTSGLWVVEHRGDVRRQIVSVLNESPYILAPGRGEAHGGGGGGDHDKVAASKGTAPKFAKEQLTPPAAVVRDEAPKLAVDPTLVGPPEVQLPQSSQAGDPLAKILTPSNGTGAGGGIGSGKGGGIGVGTGPGLGTGEGGGIGGGIYNVGGGVSAPRPIYDPDPEYSEEARKAKYQGSVMLQAVIAPDGHPRDLQVVRSLGMGLDQKALEAVNRWKFEPAVKDGRPVAVRVQIEVAFRLY